ncbi:MAG: HD domain-containing protein [Verrucomicrobiota bacterium]
MEEIEYLRRLKFIQSAERLKDTLRSAHTTEGRPESVAEHTWRLTLLILVFSDALEGIDLLKLLKICILHDLGEAIDGDIPAPEQDATAPKSDKERNDFRSLLDVLPDTMQTEFLSLWDEYENVESTEARIAKAFDKIETLIQHNQGKNPEGFDYAFNLDYGKQYTDALPLAKEIRSIIDRETHSNARRSFQ